MYDFVEKNKVAEISYPFNKDEDVVIRFDEKKNIYIADSAGIHRANMEDTSFTTLVDSKATTIGMTSSMVTGMEIDTNGNIWCVIEEFNTGKTDLYCYSYMKLEGIESTLTLYTMKESDWLKKLVIDFQNTYPQYRINMVIDNDKAMTTQDKLSSLIEVMKLMKDAGYVAEIDEYAQGILEEYGDRFGLICLPTFNWTTSMAYHLAADEANVALNECSSISMEVLGIASHFVSFALSEAEQSSYVEDGVPITYEGLASLTKVQNPNVGMGFNLPDGSELELCWPTETEISNFVELCKKVDRKQHIEQVIVQMLKAQCEKFLMGEASEQETSESITNQIKTYLEEQR